MVLGDLALSGVLGTRAASAEEAMAWYKRAGEDDMLAQTSIGWMYETGKAGAKRDFDAAVRWVLNCSDSMNVTAT